MAEVQKLNVTRLDQALVLYKGSKSKWTFKSTVRNNNARSKQKNTHLCNTKKRAFSHTHLKARKNADFNLIMGVERNNSH